ncbi:MAG: GNAT family N-acetyltransferase [Flavihumibacter sp.]|nr:GNAT family N-acetyltransferase [Flavihumibacter sp.]
MKTEFEIKSVPFAWVLPIRQEVMYPGKSAELANVAGDDEAIHWGLFVSDKLVSVISLFNSLKYGRSLQFRKFATLVTEQGKGYGSRLLQQVVDYGISEGYTVIWCNARISALGFYERFGFCQDGDGWQKNGIDYIIIKKALR